jgi:hypothetical protein
LFTCGAHDPFRELWGLFAFQGPVCRAWRKTIPFYDGEFRPWSRSEYRPFEPSSVKIAFPVTGISEIVRRLRRRNRAN